MDKNEDKQGMKTQDEIDMEKVEVAVTPGTLGEALLQKTGMAYPIRGGWGTGIEDAIEIMGGGVDMEYVIMSRLFPGCEIQRQELMEKGERRYDVITFADKAGEQYRVYFDITGFYSVPGSR